MNLKITVFANHISVPIKTHQGPWEFSKSPAPNLRSYTQGKPYPLSTLPTKPLKFN